MALKFLNKKGWHTGSLRNIENVWKAEQKHEAEQKKLEELRKQIHEERERAEFRQLQEQAGLVPRQERLEFLYDSGLAVGKTSGFESLPAKTDPPDSSAASSSASKPQSAAPGALFEDKPQSANDAWRKLHSDPLLLIRQREQEALAHVKNNPVKMAMIRKSVEAAKLKDKTQDEKDEKHKRKHHKKKSKHHKKSKHRGSSSDEDSRDEYRDQKHDMQPRASDSRNDKDHEDYKHKRSIDYEDKKHKDTRASDSRSDKDRGDYKHKRRHDSIDYEDQKRKDTRVSDSRSYRDHGDYKHKSRHDSIDYEDQKHKDSRASDSRSDKDHGDYKHESRHNNSIDYDDQKHKDMHARASDLRSDRDRGDYKHRTKDNGVGSEGGQGQRESNPEGIKRRNPAKLSEEERAARLREMQLDAELHEEQRWKRLKKADENDAKEAVGSQSSGGKSFLDAAHRSIYGAEKGGSSTIEESIRRRTHYLQGRSDATERNAFRR